MADEKIEIEIVLDDGSIKKGFANVSRSSKTAGKEVGENFSRGISSSLAGLAGKVVGFLGLRTVTRDLLEFEKATAEIRTITQGLNIDQKELNKTLLDTSKAFGTSPQAQAKTFYQIISAGITDAAEANEVLIASNKLAVGGLTSTEGAVDLLTTTLNSYGSTGLTAARASDILFGTVKLGKTRIEELQSSMGSILPTAAAIGVGFEDVNGALAQLTTKGISTSEAVTQLNAVFTAVFKKQDTAKTFGKDVANAFSIQSLQTKGLTKFLRDLNGTLGGSTEKLTKLLGRAEGAKAILALASDGFKGMDDKVKELQTSTGAADDAFKEMANTIGFKLNKVTSTFRATMVSLSATTDSFVTDVLDAVIFGFENLNQQIKIFGGIGNLAQAIFFNIGIAMRDADLALTNFLGKFGSFGKLIAQGLTGGTKEELEAARLDLENRIVNLVDPESLQEPAERAREAGKMIGKGVGEGIGEGVTETIEFSKDAITLSLDSILKDFQLFKQSIKVTSKQISATLVNGMAKGATNAFSSFGRAIAQGKNGFEAFGNAVLSSIGSMLSSLGQSFVLQGIAHNANPLTPGAGTSLIASGLALSVFGGVLGGLSGGASGGGSGGSSDGGVGIDDQEDIITVDDVEEPSSSVVVNVEGTVLDPAAVGQQIVDVLNEAGFTNGARVIA